MPGLIYVAIAVAWLAYLVPLFVRRKGDEEAIDPRAHLSGVRIIRDDDAEPAPTDPAHVSTPLTRRAAMSELRRVDRQQAKRRSAVLVVLMAIQSAAVVMAAAGWVPRWVVLIPLPLLVGFFCLARWSVRRMHDHLQARLADIRGGGSEEMTVLLGDEASVNAELEHTAEVAAQSEVTGSLWEPLPVTTPTYVSRPLAPRTVRTIDLSSPELTESMRRPVMGQPVVADARPAPSAVDVDSPRDDEGDDLPKAVGE